jgi:hypothetical protein
MSIEHSPARQGGDRLLSHRECWEDLGVSRATYFRNVKPLLPIVQITVHRQGVRQSALEDYKQSRTRPGRAA